MMANFWRVAGIVAGAGWVASLAGGCATGAGREARRQVVVEREVVYTPEGWPAQIKADVYRPEGAKGAPVVLVLHGGGWTKGDRRWHMDGIAEALARRGFVAVNATYRTTPEWMYPAPLEDLREALRWVRANAERLGADAERAGVFGYSAGGHLALMLGLQDGPQGAVRVRAVVAGGAPADLRFYEGGKLVPLFMGGSKAERPERYAEASPVTHASAGDPPVFFYHGRWDRLVPPEHAEAMMAGLARAGVGHEVRWLAGRGHFAAFVWEGDAEERAMDFLARELGVGGVAKLSGID